MNADKTDPPSLAWETLGAMPDDTWSSAMRVKFLEDRLAQLTGCGRPAPMPPACSRALDAWLLTQMSDEQFVEFSAAYGRWVEERRSARGAADFRVELTPRPSTCQARLASSPVPKDGAIPATTPADDTAALKR